jgi:hypothetical protein
MRLVVDHIPIQPSGISAGHVGKITENEIKQRFGTEYFEKIATHKVDPPAGAVPSNVPACHRECGRAYVHGEPAGVRDLPGKRNGDTARTGAHIDESDRAVSAFTRQSHSPLYEQLRLRAWNEHGRAHCETEAIELLPAGDVLERDTGGTLSYERCVPLPVSS